MDLLLSPLFKLSLLTVLIISTLTICPAQKIALIYPDRHISQIKKIGKGLQFEVSGSSVRVDTSDNQINIYYPTCMTCGDNSILIDNTKNTIYFIDLLNFNFTKIYIK